ncbi:TPA: hypothetical protein N0F65_012875, partial [Lagenidium giganteum]
QEYYQGNREAILAKTKERYQKNRKERLDKQKAYDEAHKEAIAARFKEKKYWQKKSTVEVDTYVKLEDKIKLIKVCKHVKANGEQCKLSPKKERCHKHPIQEEIVDIIIETPSDMGNTSPIEVVDMPVESEVAPTEESKANVIPEQVSSVEKPTADSTVYMAKDTLKKNLNIFNPEVDWAFDNLSKPL